MTVPGRAGAFEFQLLESLPAHPAKGLNRWTLEILDATAAPIVDANLSVALQMPDHGGHGPTRRPEVSAEGTVYHFDSLDFFMVGLWQITVFAQTEDRADSADFYFCIEG